MDSSSSSTSNSNSHLLFSLFQTTVTDPQNDHLLGGGGGAPKLEDFLGGPTVAAHFDACGGGGGPNIVYNVDSDQLKSIAAATFLQAGFSSSDQNSTPRTQLAIAPPPPPPPAKKALDTFGHRTSIFRGVTRHRWTGRYEAHLWDNSCRREGQSRKGRQVYLGGYDKEEKAARAYDLAALKYWGPTTTTNFPVSDYERELEEMKHMTRQEFVASLRRKSTGFSRGASMYRGVTRHHQHGRWQARIGRVAGNKDLYLGTFSTQEEAAEAYDIAAIKFRGLNAVTNFDMTRYDVKSIASSSLPIGGPTKPPKTTSESALEDSISATSALTSPTINFALPIKQDQSSSLWAALGYPKTPAATNNSATMFEEGTTPYSAEYHPTEGYLNVCGGYYQECDGTTRMGSNGTSHDAVQALSSNNGNWINPQTEHAFQGAKPNLTPSFQTPIFGIE